MVFPVPFVELSPKSQLYSTIAPSESCDALALKRTISPIEMLVEDAMKLATGGKFWYGLQAFTSPPAIVTSVKSGFV